MRRWLLLAMLGVSGAVFADTGENLSEIQVDNAKDWVDKTRHSTKRWLNARARVMDDWFGATNPNEPATASLRLMLDYHHTDEGETLKPKVRGRLKLPTLEHRLSLMIGDDGVDDERLAQKGDGVAVGAELIDKERTKTENGSLALRLSRWSKSKQIDHDIDIGVRSKDGLYLRLHAKKDWQYSPTHHGYIEQMYRYGSRSEHYLRSNFGASWVQSPTVNLNYHAYLDYTHKKDDETIVLGNQLYNAHRYRTPLGVRTLSYGVQFADTLGDGVSLNRFGAFGGYRQPIFKDWLFIQGEVSVYNDRADDKGGRVDSFLRLEAVF